MKSFLKGTTRITFPRVESISKILIGAVKSQVGDTESDGCFGSEEGPRERESRRRIRRIRKRD